MSQPAAGGVTATFSDFRHSTKILIWVMLGMGVVLFSVCLVADLTGADWMETYAYIPNILAGLTGFLIGVPFALVVFATLASQRDQKSAADRVNAISQLAWNQYRDAITMLCSPERIQALEASADRIQGIHDETWHGFNTDIANQSDEEFQQTVAFAQQQSQLWGEAFQSFMNDVGKLSDLTLLWLAAVRDWNTLDQYVRVQRLERGLPWFHRELDTQLQQRMIADKHPMRPFFDLHDREGQQSNRYGRAQDMYTALDRVSTLGQMGYSRDTFVRVWQYTDQYPVTRVEGYLYTAKQVAHEMGMLYAFVQQVDRSGWPAVAPDNPPLAS